MALFTRKFKNFSKDKVLAKRGGGNEKIQCYVKVLAA